MIYKLNISRIYKLCLLLLFLFFTENQFAQDPTFINPIAAGFKPSELLAPGWNIFKKVEGDLNKDGLDDLVLVLRHVSEEKEKNPSSRILLIYFKENDGMFHLQEYKSDFILKMDEGGMMGDPFQNISIQKGSILIEHSGGSRERWSYKHRFQLRDKGILLIGRTETIVDSATGVSKTTDYNLITGKVEILEQIQNKKPTKKTTNYGIKVLPLSEASVTGI